MPTLSIHARLLLALLLALFPESWARAAGPARVFDAKFSPPISQVSALNSGSVMLAVQLAPGSMGPGRVISIDKRGKTAVVEELGGVRELSVPDTRLWIADQTVKPGEEGKARSLPVTGVHVYISGSGETYTVVYLTAGAYYELRHKDSHGRTLFMTGPRDPYGLKTVIVSYDGSRVLVVDETQQFLAAQTPGIGQRICLYDRDGRLLADRDYKGELDAWLDPSGGFMASDGSYFIAARGMGERPMRSLVMFNAQGRESWENTYFKSHTLMDDYGGIFRVKGGSGSLISFIDKEGALKVLERKGYGFDFWLSPGAAFAYVIMFKQFDVLKSGVPEEIKTLFPGARVVTVDLQALLPEKHVKPRVVIASDGGAFIFTSFEPLEGREKAAFSYYDASHYDNSLKQLWDESFFQTDITPQFVDGSRGFILKFGYPVTRLSFYEARR